MRRWTIGATARGLWVVAALVAAACNGRGGTPDGSSDTGPDTNDEPGTGPWECLREPDDRPVLDRVGSAPTVLVEEDELTMWYAAFSSETGILYHATSRDGVSWSPAGWDRDHRLTFEGHSTIDADHYGPTVVRGRDGELWMYYYDELSGAISRSTSSNGIDWSNETVVLRPDPGITWEGCKVTSPSVVERQGVYWMLYMGEMCQEDPDDPGNPEVVASAIGLATSEDGLTWERSSANPLLPVGDPGVVHVGELLCCPEMREQGDELVLWYARAPSDGHPSRPTEIRVATSADGSVWTPQEDPVLVPVLPFEGPTVSGPAAVVEGGGQTLWYAGLNDFSEPSIGRARCRRGR